MVPTPAVSVRPVPFLRRGRSQRSITTDRGRPGQRQRHVRARSQLRLTVVFTHCSQPVPQRLVGGSSPRPHSPRQAQRGPGRQANLWPREALLPGPAAAHLPDPSDLNLGQQQRPQEGRPRPLCRMDGCPVPASLCSSRATATAAAWEATKHRSWPSPGPWPGQAPTGVHGRRATRTHTSPKTRKRRTSSPGAKWPPRGLLAGGWRSGLWLMVPI